MPCFFSPTPSSQRGNVLLLTLLVMVLFAALTYTLIVPPEDVSSDQEKDIVSAAQITQYPAMLRTTVHRMQAQGVAVADLSFAEDDMTPAGVFSPSGGSAAKQGPLDSVGSTGHWHFRTAPKSGSGWFIAGIGSDGAAGKDVFAFLDELTLPVCSQILRALGLPEEPLVEETPVDLASTNEGTPQQTGGAGATEGASQGAHAFSAWARAGQPQPYACVRNGVGGSYIYYHILIDR